MHTPHALFRFFGKSLLNLVPYAAFGVPLPVGDFAFEVVPALLRDVWSGLFEKDPDVERRATIEAIARLSEQEAAVLAEQVAREVAGDQSEEARRLVAGYLRQIPPSVRATLRRPADPTGTTVPARRVPRSADDLAPLFPTRLPRFQPGDRPGGIDRELIRCLGVGGFGEVWLAFNPFHPNRPPVALKIPRDDAVDLLRNEARLLGRLEAHTDTLHPGVVRLLDTHLGANPPSLDYEYVEGFELTTLIRDWHADAPGPNPLMMAEMIRDLAEIVGSVHRLKPPVVHRDLKPANILVVAQPGSGYFYRITDFGIGGLAAERELSLMRAGSASSRVGSLVTAARGAYSPLYSPVRQVRAEDPHPSDDLFALGVIWYQALTGDLLGGCPAGSFWKRSLLNERGMASGLLRLLESCFDDDPAVRPRDADHLAATLNQLVKKPRDTSRPPSTSPAAPSPTSAQPSPPTGSQSWVGQSPNRVPEKTASPPPIPTPKLVTSRAPSPERLWPFLRTIVVAVLPVVLVFGLLITYAITNYGRIKIVVDGPTPLVKVDGGAVRIEAQGEPITLHAGDHELAVKWSDGELKTLNFFVHRGENTDLRVEYEPTRIGTPTARPEVEPKRVIVLHVTPVAPIPLHLLQDRAPSLERVRRFLRRRSPKRSTSSWYYDLQIARSAYRGWSTPAYRNYDVGFRLARVQSGR